MLLVLVSSAFSFLVLSFFRQNFEIDTFPIILIGVSVLIVSGFFTEITQGAVKTELETKHPKKIFREDYEIEGQFATDLKLLLFGLIYSILIGAFAYSLHQVISDSWRLILLFIPIIAILFFDVLFYIYCKDNTITSKLVFSIFIYHEARFMGYGIYVVLLFIGGTMYVPIILIMFILKVILEIV